MDLDKYYDVYDISDLDYSEAMLGYTEGEFDDEESVRVLKIFAARFHTIRKIFLCCLLAFDAHGGKPDFHRWGLAVDELHTLCSVTSEAEDKLRRILGEEESKLEAIGQRRADLTCFRFSSTNHSKITPYPRPRARASSITQIKYTFIGDSWSTSEIARFA